MHRYLLLFVPALVAAQQAQQPDPRQVKPEHPTVATHAWTVAPGYTDPIKFADGNPYGTSHIAGHGDLPITGTTRQAAAYQGARVVKIAAALKAGLHAS